MSVLFKINESSTMAEGYEPCALIYLGVSRFMRVFFFFFLYAPRSRLQTRTSVVQRRVIASFPKCSPHRGNEEVMVFLYLFYPSTEREYSVVSGALRSVVRETGKYTASVVLTKCIGAFGRAPPCRIEQSFERAHQGYKLKKKTEGNLRASPQ